MGWCGANRRWNGWWWSAWRWGSCWGCRCGAWWCRPSGGNGYGIGSAWRCDWNDEREWWSSGSEEIVNGGGNGQPRRVVHISRLWGTSHGGSQYSEAFVQELARRG